MGLCVPGAFGHPDHTILELDDAVSEAKFHIIQLIEKKSLPETWQDVKPDIQRSGVQQIRGKRRWVFIYEKDLAKKTIKIFMTPLGQFISFEYVPSSY
jgi:hypothetical protein